MTFATAGAAGAPFTGNITSTGIAAIPVNSDIAKVDGGDIVRFAVLVENVGSASGGAFDVSVKDLIPAGFEAVVGNLNFSVRDGNGNVLGFTDLGGGPNADTGAGLFGNGIRIDDAVGQGSLHMFNGTAGDNIAVVTYDLRATTALEVGSTATTNATLFNYSSGEGLSLIHI